MSGGKDLWTVLNLELKIEGLVDYCNRYQNR